jgi:hypothetical protein
VTIRHVRVLPQAYTIEPRPDGLVDVWLCRQVDTYTTEDGIREFDVDIRVMCEIPENEIDESDIRARFESWWDAAGS